MGYWKKDDPGNKVSTNISLVTGQCFDGTTGTSNIHITGLDANTTYCVEVIGDISPYGESYTEYGGFHWTHGPPEKRYIGGCQFNTLPE